MQHGLAKSTTKVYHSAQRMYLKFCSRLHLQPLPASEAVLLLFVAEKAQTVSHSTIKSYLAGIRNLHIMKGYGNPIADFLRLELAVRGVQRLKPRTRRPRLPITPYILRLIKAALSENLEYNSVLYWAVCCTAYFGFMRCGELLLSSPNAFDRARHITPEDVATDSQQDPQSIQIHLRFSKTDQIGRGSFVYLGRTNEDLCPVGALLSYLVVRPKVPGPLFITQDGAPLTKPLFISRIQHLLSSKGVEARHYQGHSFRIGAATTAASNGVPDHLIKTLGRWASSCYQLYIQSPTAQLAEASAQLVNSRPST